MHHHCISQSHLDSEAKRLDTSLTEAGDSYCAELADLRQRLLRCCDQAPVGVWALRIRHEADECADPDAEHVLSSASDLAMQATGSCERTSVAKRNIMGAVTTSGVLRLSCPRRLRRSDWMDCTNRTNAIPVCGLGLSGNA